MHMQAGHMLVRPPSQSAVTSVGTMEDSMTERCGTTGAEETTIIREMQRCQEDSHSKQVSFRLGRRHVLSPLHSLRGPSRGYY